MRLLVWLFVAQLATWRLTHFITVDRLFEPVRKRWPSYLWSCPYCASVWAAAICAVLWWFAPWVNVIGALAWGQVWLMYTRAARQQARGVTNSLPVRSVRVPTPDEITQVFVGRMKMRIADLTAQVDWLQTQLEATQVELQQSRQATEVNKPAGTPVP